MISARPEYQSMLMQRTHYVKKNQEQGKSKLHSAMIFFLIISFCHVHLAHGQVLYPGTCMEQTVVQNFDVTRYLGLWYENRNYFTFFQLKLSCVTATYSQLPNETNIVRVLNSSIKMGSPSNIEGQAELVNPIRNEAKLRVSFPGNFFSSATTDPSDDGNYWVLDTDYNSYSVVWSCRQNLAGLNNQYLWVLTRERYPSLKTLSQALTAIETRGLDTNALAITEQTDCPAT